MQASALPAPLDLPLTRELGLLRSVVTDAELILNSGSPLHAKISGIERVLAERVPVPLIPHAPAITPAALAGQVAAALIAADGPATDVLASLAGTETILRTVGPHIREPDEDERTVLRLRPGDRLYVREGYFMAGTLQVAKTMLRLAPDRITALAGPQAWGRIRSGQPCGAVLGPLGMTRPRREVAVRPGENFPVRACSVLWLKSCPVGISSEEIPDSLLAHLAEQVRRER